MTKTFVDNDEMFRQLLQEQSSVRDLLEAIKSPDNAVALLARIELLVREQDDIRYRNTRDAALAVYIWALNQSRPSYGKLAASLVLSASRLWWARKAALKVFGDSFVSSSPDLNLESVFTTSNWNLGSDDKETFVLAADEWIGFEYGSGYRHG